MGETLSLSLLHEHSKAPTMGQAQGLALETQWLTTSNRTPALMPLIVSSQGDITQANKNPHKVICDCQSC